MENEIIIYQTEDGKTKIDLKIEDKTVWLSQKEIAELFQKDVRTVNEHLKNIIEDGELSEDSVIRNFRITATDGKDYDVNHYNLDAIIAVGYRVKSHRGTQFRIWANQVLKEYLIKGFAMNDDLLKQAGGGNYWKELLDRIRDIRSSEKVFYRQILDIYATSIDYNPKAESSILFFQTVQNKMHFAAHGHTAAELIYERANAEQNFMGMTNFKGYKPTVTEAKIAKNYLNKEELDILNSIVSAYLEFAELQAKLKRPMYMKDWIEKLDDFIKMTGSELLKNAGIVQHKVAVNKAIAEYNKYKEKTKQELTKVEMDFLDTLKHAEKQVETHKKGGE